MENTGVIERAQVPLLTQNEEEEDTARSEIRPQYYAPDQELHDLHQRKPGHSIAVSRDIPFRTGTIVSWVLETARTHPGKPAVRSPRLDSPLPNGSFYREISYAQLVAGAQHIAKQLLSKKENWRNTFVAVILERDIEFFVCAFGVILAGAAYLPISETQSLKMEKKVMGYYLEDSEAPFVVTTRPYLARIKEFQQKLNFETIMVDDFHADQIRPEHNLQAVDDQYRCLNTDPDDLAYMIYTSGTTGNPKGVMVPHRGVVNMMANHLNNLKVGHDLEKATIVANLIFDSSIRETWLPLVGAGCLCVAENVTDMSEGTMCAGTPSGLLVSELPMELRTVMVGGERLDKPVIDKINSSGSEGVKRILNAYGPTECTVECLMHETDVNKPEEISWIGKPIQNMHVYGIKLVDEEWLKKPYGVDGYLEIRCEGAGQDAEYEYLDKDTGKWQKIQVGDAVPYRPDLRYGGLEIAPVNTKCELIMGGVGVSRGYWRKLDKTREKFLPNVFQELNQEWFPDCTLSHKLGQDIEGKDLREGPQEGWVYRTGDVVLFHTCGDLEFRGRTDSQIKFGGGLRIELEEVERHTQSAEVGQNVVQVVKHGGEEHLVMWMARAEGCTLSDEEIEKNVRTFGRANLKNGDKTVPTLILIFDSLPKKAGGKVDKKKLLEDPAFAPKFPDKVPPTMSGEYIAPADEWEDNVVQALAATMSTPEMEVDPYTISCTADFFDELGLGSLACAAFSSIHLKKKGYETGGTRLVFANPSVKALAGALRAKAKANIKLLREDEVADIYEAPSGSLPWFLVLVITFFGILFTLLVNAVLPIYLVVLTSTYISRWAGCGYQWVWNSDKWPWEDLDSTECTERDQWNSIYMVALWTPVLLILVFVIELFAVFVVKWLFIGCYKRGVHAINSCFYLKWWLVHTQMHFLMMFMLGPLRNTGALVIWYRLLGAKIGKGVVLDTAAIYDFDLINVGSGAAVQSDALIHGHAMRHPTGQSGNKSIEKRPGQLILGPVVISQDTKIGPYAEVGPVDHTGVLREEPVQVTQTLPAMRTSYSLTDPLCDNLSEKDALKQTVYTPAVPVCWQLLGLTLLFLFTSIAVAPGVALLHYMLLNQVAMQWYPLFHFFWVLNLGTPWVLIVIVFKWIFIGQFKEGPTSDFVAVQRWMLDSFLMSRLTATWVGVFASCTFLSTFYRLLGAKVGWNVQVMPFFCNTFDLVDVDDSVAFGGQVSIFCHDHTGYQRKSRIGKNSAVTNSAIMMSGSNVGDNALVGDLTLVPPEYQVLNEKQCVGNPCFTKGGPPPEAPATTRDQSNWIMFLHCVFCFMVEMVDQPIWWTLFYVLGNPAYNNQGPLYFGNIIEPADMFRNTCLFVFWFTIGTLFVIGIIKRFLLAKMAGEGPRDSWLFVQFMYITKLSVTTDQHIYHMMNGTPWMPLMYQYMGANVSLTSILWMRHTGDFDLLRIGEHAIMGFDTYTELHQKTATELKFEPILIGDGATLGSRTIMTRGLSVRDDATVQAMSLTTPGEKLEARTLWGGSPATTKHQPSMLSSAGMSVNGRQTASMQAADAHEEALTNRVARATQSRVTATGRVTARATNAGARSGGLPYVRSAGLPYGASAAASVSQSNLWENRPTAQPNASTQKHEYDVEMVILGAGLMGLNVAYMCKKAGVDFKIIEKDTEPMGCWRTAANTTSHVAVSEPAYRLPGWGEATDYTQQEEVVRKGKEWLQSTGIDKNIKYGTQVVNIVHKNDRMVVITLQDGSPQALTSEDRAYFDNQSDSEKLREYASSLDNSNHYNWVARAILAQRDTLHQRTDGKGQHTMVARGICICKGGQQGKRLHDFKGEVEKFKGVSAYGVCADMEGKDWKGKKVVIVGSGAFSVENARTALIKGAEHVTIVYRTSFQCWPRIVHYKASLGGLPFSALEQYYNDFMDWAGVTPDTVGEDNMPDEFFSLKTMAQPTASDFLYGGFKAGKISLVKGEIEEVDGNFVLLHKCVDKKTKAYGPADISHVPNHAKANNPHGVDCDILLKCLGWDNPSLTHFYPSFKTRKWVFLDDHPNVCFVADPHYQNKDTAAEHASQGLELMREVLMAQTPKGGTYSCLILARLCGALMIYAMSRPETFHESIKGALKKMTTESGDWFDQKFEGWTNNEVERLIDETLDEGKDFMTQKFITTADFLTMAQKRFDNDLDKVRNKPTDVDLSYPRDLCMAYEEDAVRASRNARQSNRPSRPSLSQPPGFGVRPRAPPPQGSSGCCCFP